MKSEKWQGILPPVTTPFSEDGELRLDFLLENLERYQDTEIAGVLALGSNGEAIHLNERERFDVVQVFQDAAGRLPVMVGVSEPTLRTALSFIDRISNGRVDGLLVSVPGYYRNRMTRAAIVEFYTALAEASPFPVFLYNVPQYSGLRIESRWVHELSDHPNIHGMKDSSGDLSYLQQVLGGVDSGVFQVILGSAQVLLPARLLGIRAGIVALACAFPRWASQILEVRLDDPANVCLL